MLDVAGCIITLSVPSDLGMLLCAAWSVLFIHQNVYNERICITDKKPLLQGCLHTLVTIIIK